MSDGCVHQANSSKHSSGPQATQSFLECPLLLGHDNIQLDIIAVVVTGGSCNCLLSSEAFVAAHHKTEDQQPRGCPVDEPIPQRHGLPTAFAADLKPHLALSIARILGCSLALAKDRMVGDTPDPILVAPCPLGLGWGCRLCVDGDQLSRVVVVGKWQPAADLGYGQPHLPGGVT